MQTIKTGVVVALLLAVCYGAFVALNAPEPDLPDELLSEFDWNPDEAGLENLTNIEMPGSESLALQTPAGTDLNATGGLGAFDASNLSIPSLPPLNGGNSNGGASLGPSAGGSSMPGSPVVDLPAVAGLPSNNSAPSNVVDGARAPSDLMLPTLPNEAGGLSANNLLPGNDGPSVPWNGGPGGTADSVPKQTPTPQPQSEAPITPGQMVSQPLNAKTDVDSANGAKREQPTLPFAAAREQALELAGNGKLRDALQILTRYYDSPELSSEQHGDMIDLLDALTREVIYSPRHLAESPYTVKAGDTIESLANVYHVTPELLSRINGLGDSKALVTGSQIKVLPGPFRAEVSLSRNELTIFLGDLYAGRFPVSFGSDPSPVEGAYEVIDRSRERTYYGTGFNIIKANDNRNPYGGYWLNLGQDLCIHGTPEMSSDDLQGAGCISLAPLDAADVYHILAQTSEVAIVH